MDKELNEQILDLEYALEDFFRAERKVKAERLYLRSTSAVIEALAALRLTYNPRSISRREGQQRNNIKRKAAALTVVK